MKVLFFTILLLIPVAALASERPTEFRGIKWGGALNDIHLEQIDSGQNHFRAGDILDYHKDDDDLIIAGCKVNSIKYRTIDDKLVSVYIEIKSDPSFQGIKSELINLYGSPDKTSNDSVFFEWNTKNDDEADIFLRYSPGYSTLSFKWHKYERIREAGFKEDWH